MVNQIPNELGSINESEIIAIVGKRNWEIYSAKVNGKRLSTIGRDFNISPTRVRSIWEKVNRTIDNRNDFLFGLNIKPANCIRHYTDLQSIEAIQVAINSGELTAGKYKGNPIPNFGKTSFEFLQKWIKSKL